MLITKAERRIEQILAFVKKNRYRVLFPLEFEYFETAEAYRSPPGGGNTDIKTDTETDIKWEKINLPYEYGKPWHCSWFRSSFTAPASGKYPLYLRVIPNADSLVFIDGKPAGAFNPIHKKVKVEADGKSHILHIESYAGHHFPGSHPFQGGRVMLTLGRTIDDYPNVFAMGALTERVEPIYGLYYDALCLYEVSKTLDNNSLRKAKIISGLYDALMDIHYSSSGTALEEEAAAARLKLAPLMEAKNGSTVPEIHLVGHAHIDHAWLWHIGETERKIARTYINMCRLAEEYPEFIFIQSQSAQLENVKQEYPEIFEAVKEAYRRGSWEPNGGMWVEADCNITGGESLIRQFLVGKRAFRELLGDEAATGPKGEGGTKGYAAGPEGDGAGHKAGTKGFTESDTLWLPDVFGYAAALPQILAGCRIDYFITSKMNWNDTTRFPYDTFIWRGLDGTGIKTHYITSRMRGYNGRVYPADLADTWNNVQHKEIQSAAIKPIGEGDGGGGTARGDLEMTRRLKDLEGAPKAAWKKVSAALKEIFTEDSQWPEWRGELYLELHRGTYTTQAAIKRYNRKLEFALRNAEFLSALALIEQGSPFPHERLLKHWKILLTNQFHDIIPGSSIARVNQEARESYKAIEEDLSDLSGELLKNLASSGSDSAGGKEDSEQGLRVINDLSWERNDPLYFPADFAKGVSAFKPYWDMSSKIFDGLAENRVDEIYPLQAYVDLEGEEKSVFCPGLPSLGWANFVPAEFTPQSPSFFFRGNSLKTPLYEVGFDNAGRISSLFDLENDRELCAAGGILNGFVSAQDVPVLWEAWDIDAHWTRYITEETRLVSTEISASGPVCIKIRRKYTIGEASTLTQDMTFYAGNPRVDFDTLVDWREKQRLLKVQFDTAIDSAQIRCEVQYGHLFRNTHKNLPNDRARFEFCAHKWVSLEEEGGGIALMNDSKYGHEAEGGRLRLTLLRSPTAPDGEADRGIHRFSYALLPFRGSFGESGLVKRSYEFNDPARALPAPAGSSGLLPVVEAEYSLFSIGSESIIAEAIKVPEPQGPAGAGAMAAGQINSGAGAMAEKRLLIRLYESLGGPVKTVLHFNRPLAEAAETDMLEENPRALPVNAEEIYLEFRAFEIKTVMVTFK